MQRDSVTHEANKSASFSDWPTGFLGYNSWSTWFLGITIADQNERERRRLKSFYEECGNPRSEIQQTPIDNYELNAFWQWWAQVAIIKPLQIKLILATLLAFFGNPRWAVVLYGKKGSNYVKENQYKEAWQFKITQKKWKR